MEAPNSSITQHLEGFLLSAQKLEDALGEEKKRSQKIAQEYLATRTTLENAVRELQNRLIQRENKIQAITQAYHAIQAGEARLKTEMREITEREKKSAAALMQYQSAWNEVLAREAQARGTLIEFEKAKNLLNEQKTQFQAMEAKIAEANQNAATHFRHAETYQRELQGALIRIQSADSKYNQIQKELSILSQNRRNADEEIARIEASMKERFRWEIATEKERLRAELEKDSALDRERFREIARNQTRAEIERLTLPDRKTREAAEAELVRVKTVMTEIEVKLHQAIERAEQAEKAILETKNDVAMQQMESGNAQIKIETIRKESNKAMLIERLRHDDEIRDLRMKIEQLLDRGVYAERVEEIPDGMRVYSATSVTISRPSRDGSIEESIVRSEENPLR